MSIGTRRAWIRGALALGAMPFALGSAGDARAAEVLQALHGRWTGSGIDILIDTERMQGNVDPLKPFNRDPLVIRDVTPPWVVFAIGISTFVAQLGGETMTITQPGWPSPRIVARRPHSRPAPLAQAARP